MSTCVHRAAALLGLLLPVAAALAAEQVAPVANTLRTVPPPLAATPASPSAVAVPQQTAVAASVKPAAYVPKTAYDNSPYRFNAGARFTAAEFDAWMQSRGIRVAKGNPAAGPAVESATGVPASTGTAVDAAACDAQSLSAC